MKTVTLRKIPRQVQRLIDKKAKQEGTSANKAVIELLEECAGISQKERDSRLYHDLDSLSGSWSKEEATAFDKALQRQRKIDDELWK